MQTRRIPRPRRALLSLFALALTLVLAALPARAAAPDPAAKLGRAADPARAHDPAHVLVKLKPGIDPVQALPAGSTPILGRWYKVPVPAGETAKAMLDRQAKAEAVELVELNYVARAFGAVPLPRAGTASLKLAVNDPLAGLQWNLAMVQAPRAWDVTTGAGVKVAVVDTGVSAVPDLACRPFADEYNALTERSGPGAAADDDGHGTHVAGTIAQCTNNGLGVAGLAFNATLMPVKVLGPDGGTADDIAQGIDWARAHGARVINLSLGVDCENAPWPDCSSSIQDEAIERAAAANVVLVAAAGNSNQWAVDSPANHPDVIAVGAVDLNGTKAPYSSYGAALDLVAPGGNVAADYDGDGVPEAIFQDTLGAICEAATPSAVCPLQGTSMASPHVAAAAALLRAFRPGANREQVQAALQLAALDLGTPGFDSTFGAGLLQAADSLAMLDLFARNPEPPCLAGDFSLCLGGGRFEVAVAWRRSNGETGLGRAVALTGDTGYFWFFNGANVEMVIKVLDACGLNGRYWVFAGGLTDVEVQVQVRDAVTGAVKQYRNPPGRPFQPIQDTNALAVCL